MKITKTERRAMELGADLIQRPDNSWAWRTLTAYSGGWQTSEQAAKDFLKYGTGNQ